MVLLRTRCLAAVKARFSGAFGAGWAGQSLTALVFALGFTFADAGGQILGERLWPAGVVQPLWAPLASAPARGLALGLLIVLAQAFARSSPRWWWIVLSVLASILIFILVLVPPLTVIPSARRDRPAPASASASILAFVEEGGLKPDRLEVYAGSDPTDVDMEGIGSVTRAAVSRAALARPQAETFAAIGHLLGHYRNHDLWLMALVLSLLATGLFALLGPGAAVLLRRLGRPHAAAAGDSAALGVLGLLVWSVLPLEHAGFNLFDQAINFRADAFALSLTHDKNGLCRWLVMREAHGSIDPPVLEAVLFDSHPPTAERVRRILAQTSIDGRTRIGSLGLPAQNSP